MQDIETVKMFGTGQVTIPKRYRPKGTINFTVFKKGADIVFRPLELEIEEIDLADDGEGWETLYSARKEDRTPIEDFLKEFKRLRKEEDEKNRKVSKTPTRKGA